MTFVRMEWKTETGRKQPTTSGCFWPEAPIRDETAAGRFD